MPAVVVVYEAAERPAVVGCHFVPTTPGVDHLGVEQMGVGSSPVALALGSPAHHTGPFVVAGPAGATSPMVLDQQQS